MTELLSIMDTLLGEGGCPWDREQTHFSILPNMMEECGEAVEAIKSGDIEAMREELGDVLLQVVFHAKIAEKAGHFNFDDIVATLSKKLVDRHTHVFGADKAETGEDAMKLWKANKQKKG
ncbi:MAG: nucleotide pyrophosphohydrolase [Defluviitaleaceae bacterium]|nr:nucleotide pyrophosphohydrolase [Defluviitaleaceae bacterium]